MRYLEFFLNNKDNHKRGTIEYLNEVAKNEENARAQNLFETKTNAKKNRLKNAVWPRASD